MLVTTLPAGVELVVQGLIRGSIKIVVDSRSEVGLLPLCTEVEGVRRPSLKQGAGLTLLGLEPPVVDCGLET